MNRALGIVVGATIPLVLGACVGAGPTSDVAAERPPEEGPPPAPRCRDVPVPPEAVAVFPGTTCPWMLTLDGGTLRLTSLALEPEPAKSGAPPEACARFSCRYEGAYASIGPVVLAIEQSPQSEMPQGLHLGHATEENLRFVDLWDGAGPSVMGDFTPLGPAHGLAPYVCDGGLALLIEPRLEPGKRIEPPPELVAREGLYAPDLQSHRAADGLDRSKCERIDLPIP